MAETKPAAKFFAAGLLLSLSIASANDHGAATDGRAANRAHHCRPGDRTAMGDDDHGCGGGDGGDGNRGEVDASQGEEKERRQ
jgi:hypothetical protein